MDANLLNRMNVQIRKAYYSFTRYKTDSTFAMLYHEKPMLVQELSAFLRVSDHLIRLDNNHYFIIFTHTNESGAYKASQNLLNYIDNHFNNTSTCIAIDNFDINNSPTIVFNRLMQILEATKKSSYTRIENENILDKNIN